MKKISILVLALSTLFSSFVSYAETPVKEWTMMVYINGYNNLSDFGKLNINQMEEVGSNDNMNVVVQWAACKGPTWFSCSAGENTKRIHVQKDEDKENVTSPVVQDLGVVDMGDYRSVIDFVAWTHKNFPAKHYFLAIWNHGSGWHDVSGGFSTLASVPTFFKPLDISYDDLSKNKITTKQMGEILSESAKIIGKKIDIYGSDACLMAMGEVASEMSDSIEYFVGSQELEPGEGWPYSTFLTEWTTKPQATAREVSDMLVKNYLAAYSTGGIYGLKEVTLSAMDMNQVADFEKAVKDMADAIKGLAPMARPLVLQAFQKAQHFDTADYVDFLDFLIQMEVNKVPGISGAVLANAKGAAQRLVSSNGVNGQYFKATGLSIWMPSVASTFQHFEPTYQTLKFDQNTGWSSALKTLF